MKRKSLFFQILFASAAFAFLGNCSGDKSQTSDHEHDANSKTSENGEVSPAVEPQFEVDEKFQRQLSVVFTSYIALKEAFVDSNAEKVKKEASETDRALAEVDMKLVSGAAHNDWMNFLTPMQEALQKIKGSDNIEAQRKSFSTLSDNLYKSVKAFGLGGQEAFYEYCPMAFNNEGGYWLSDQEKIRNPYFGDKMLTCGEVKEKLK